jgi:hypothetical protein
VVPGTADDVRCDDPRMHADAWTRPVRTCVRTTVLLG